ncbi:hypothetical protein AGMMS50256_30230 [Betaproteobacteria bacterium]|nr:hypothetical protein AGMMS50256_30230 [Betaproteobacteria bacterium]
MKQVYRRGAALFFAAVFMLACGIVAGQTMEIILDNLNEILAKAQAGDAAAQFRTGDMHYKGYYKGVPHDEGKALEWFRKSAAQGNADAQYMLGVMFRDGRGIARDPVQALVWLRQSAEQGKNEAQNDLGGMYGRGEGAPRDAARATEWYRKAAEQGNAVAQNNLGVNLRDGDGVARDALDAVTWFRKAAAQDNADAQVNLAVMYLNGQGVEQNAAEGAKWMRKAANQGMALAQYNMALLDERGQGVPKNEIEAREWFFRAAENGYEKARVRAADYRKKGLLPGSEFLDLCGGDDLAAIRAALDAGMDINAVYDEGFTPLIAAIERVGTTGKTDTMRFLIERGADVNTDGGGGKLLTALIDGANKNEVDVLAIVEILVRAGADVNVVDKQGVPPLMLAALGKSPKAPELVALLIEAGADVNAASKKEGMTPLMAAAVFGKDETPRAAEIVEQLLDAGARPDTRDKKGKTVLDYARESGSLADSKALERLQGAPARQPPARAGTPVHCGLLGCEPLPGSAGTPPPQDVADSSGSSPGMAELPAALYKRGLDFYEAGAWARTLRGRGNFSSRPPNRATPGRRRLWAPCTAGVGGQRPIPSWPQTGSARPPNRAIPARRRTWA